MITIKRAQDLRISVVDNHIIRNYMKRIQDGEEIAPVLIKGTRIMDGNHRAAAYTLLGLPIPAVEWDSGPYNS